MTAKQLLCPELLRRIPRQFSWVDQRLVREGHLRGLSSEALALYLFLVIVADAQGLSYYGDTSVTQYLPFDNSILSRARDELVSARLVAFCRPLYQVLSLDIPEKHRRLPGELTSIEEILRQALVR